jgi:hypothetical protein
VYNINHDIDHYAKGGHNYLYNLTLKFETNGNFIAHIKVNLETLDNLVTYGVFLCRRNKSHLSCRNIYLTKKNKTKQKNHVPQDSSARINHFEDKKLFPIPFYTRKRLYFDSE